MVDELIVIVNELSKTNIRKKPIIKENKMVTKETISRPHRPKYRIVHCHNCGKEFWKDVLNACELDETKIISKCPRCEHDVLNIIGDRNGYYKYQK